MAVPLLIEADILTVHRLLERCRGKAAGHREALLTEISLTAAGTTTKYIVDKALMRLELLGSIEPFFQRHSEELSTVVMPDACETPVDLT